ncbi:hypothetical protein AG1IA_10350 [Rhizoctonia solani AG-1 IA]|uniref:Uncharacterized protein n=1 Tax=Thanatephorus cucumeris (strain AG1-IA) TaxID=983506 RepID=L8WCD4_THACA|nr:hypothetical protein AG1IA_10350 [Rhizoctonia solani AG-1 IA]
MDVLPLRPLLDRRSHPASRLLCDTRFLLLIWTFTRDPDRVDRCPDGRVRPSQSRRIGFRRGKRHYLCVRSSAGESSRRRV